MNSLEMTIERPSVLAYLQRVANQPSHINAKLATASWLRLYSNGGFRGCVATGPTISALRVDNTTLSTIALDSAKQQARIEQKRHAILTPLISCRSGQKRSKKKADPKMVATKTPTNML